MRVFFLVFVVDGDWGGSGKSENNSPDTHDTTHDSLDTYDATEQKHETDRACSWPSWVLALHCSLEICGLGLRLELEERLGMSLSQ